MQLLATKAKPFLKWAGGKAQLIEQIVSHLPKELKHGKLHRYVEPFVSGGALFFSVA
jgi:DNA adenine methylase